MKRRLLVIVLCFFVFPALSQAAPSGSLSDVSSIDKQINLNTADVKLLAKSVKGIGSKRAGAIVKYREDHGHFKSVNELAQVPGFGQKFVDSRANELQKIFTVQ